MACNSFCLTPLFEKEKLAENGGNYKDWIHALRYALRSAKKEYVLEQTLGDYPAPGASQDVINVFLSRKNDFSVVKSIMLACMDDVLQRRFEQSSTVKIFEKLEALFHKDTAEVHEMTEAMEECKITEGVKQGDRLADYYDSITAKGIDLPRTPEMTYSLLRFMKRYSKPMRLGCRINKSCRLINQTVSRRNATLRGTRVEHLMKLFVSTARREDTGKEIAQNIWQIRRIRLLVKV